MCFIGTFIHFTGIFWPAYTVLYKFIFSCFSCMLFFSDPSDVSCPLLIEHSYSNASASTTGTNRATTNAAVQTDMTLSDIDKILIDNKNLKEKLDDKDTLFKNIFIEKVTKSDESVRKYTGLPNLEIFNSIKNIAVNYDSNMKY